MSLRAIGRMRAGGGGAAPEMPEDGLIGAWYADEIVTSPRKVIPNSVSAEAVSPNLVQAPRRLFAKTAFYDGSGITVTDANATGPDSVANQASTISGTGNWFIGLAQVVQTVFPIGTYSFAFSYKRSGGSDQSIRAQWDFSGGQILTATSAWQRSPVISATFGTSAQHQPVIRSSDGVTGADFELCDFHVFAGTTDPHPLGETLAGHMYLGYNLADTVPTYASGLLDVSTGGLALMQFPASQTLTAFTVVQSASRVSTLANYQALISKVQAFADFTPYLEIDGYPRMGLGGTDRGTQGAGLWARTSSGLHVLMTVYNGTDIRFYIDNMLACPPVVVSSSGAFADLWNVVNGVSQYAGYKWNMLALYDRALTANERTTVQAFAVARAAETSNTITAPTRNYWAEGDSITALTGAGTGATAFGSYAYLYGQNAVAGTRGGVLAVGGAKLNNNAGNSLVERATVTDTYIVSGKTNILSVFIGANDLYNYVGGGAQYAIDVAAYCDARRAAGWKVVVGTVLPRSDASLSAGEITTHNTERAIYNTAVRTWTGVHADGVMDFAANATIGEDGDSDNTTYYSDKLHPKVAGHAIMEGIARTVLDAV